MRKYQGSRKLNDETSRTSLPPDCRPRIRLLRQRRTKICRPGGTRKGLFLLKKTCQGTDISCDDVRAAFEDEHPHNMVDACNAYALSLFPFGRDDERPEDYESEIWETGMMVGSGFKVNG